MQIWARVYASWRAMVRSDEVRTEERGTSGHAGGGEGE